MRLLRVGGGEYGIGEVQGKTIRRDRINNEVCRERQKVCKKVHRFATTTPHFYIRYSFRYSEFKDSAPIQTATCRFNLSVTQ